MLLCFIVFFALVFLCLITGISVSWALLGGLVLFWIYGRRQGFSRRALWSMAWEKCKKSLIVVTVIALIGVITGIWRMSGTIAGCILWGVSLITPQFFIVITFLLCAAMSYILGTSFGVCSTMGVILMAIARSGGVNTALTAGAVLSGAYFGDRCSPASSAAALVAAVTDTDHYQNVRKMLRTGLLPLLLTLGIYIVLSFFHPMSEAHGEAMASLQENFVISWVVLLPALAMLLLPFFKVPIKLSMAVSIVIALVIALTVQKFSLLEILRTVWHGYRSENQELNHILAGGGVTSMTSSYIVVTLTGLFSGILEGTDSIKPLTARANRLAEKIGNFPAMTVVSALAAGTLCNQVVATMMSQQLLENRYENKSELAQDIANSALLIAGIIPWSIACSTPLEMMGGSAGAIGYAFLLWLIPLCYLFTKRWFFSKTPTPSEK